MHWRGRVDWLIVQSHKNKIKHASTEMILGLSPRHCRRRRNMRLVNETKQSSWNNPTSLVCMYAYMHACIYMHVFKTQTSPWHRRLIWRVHRAASSLASNSYSDLLPWRRARHFEHACHNHSRWLYRRNDIWLWNTLLLLGKRGTKVRWWFSRLLRTMNGDETSHSGEIVVKTSLHDQDYKAVSGESKVLPVSCSSLQSPW